MTDESELDDVICRLKSNDSRLTTLHLDDYSSRNDGVLQFREYLPGSLPTRVYLHRSQLSARAAPLAESLACNSTLSRLVLRGADLRAEGVSLISQALPTNSSLASLTLAWNGMTAAEAAQIAGALAGNSTLTAPNLRS